MTSPLVSVLMPVRNAEKFLERSLESIQNQSFSNIEFVLVDDGSEDCSSQILEAYAAKDNRIVVLKNESPQGLTRSLNLGLKICRGEFLARIDADDFSRKDRLLKQFTHFQRDDKLIVLGTNARYIDDAGRSLGVSDMPLRDQSIRALMFIINPFIHSSVMLRASTVKTYGLYYNENYSAAQDYEFWVRLSQFGKLGNLGARLTELRIHSNSVSAKKRPIQISNSISVQQAYLRRSFGGGDAGDVAVERYNKFLCGGGSASIDRPLSTLHGCYYASDCAEKFFALMGKRPVGEFYRFIFLRTLKAATRSNQGDVSIKQVFTALGKCLRHSMF